MNDAKGKTGKSRFWIAEKSISMIGKDLLHPSHSNSSRQWLCAAPVARWPSSRNQSMILWLMDYYSSGGQQLCLWHWALIKMLLGLPLATVVHSNVTGHTVCIPNHPGGLRQRKRREYSSGSKEQGWYCAAPTGWFNMSGTSLELVHFKHFTYCIYCKHTQEGRYFIICYSQ